MILAQCLGHDHLALFPHRDRAVEVVALQRDAGLLGEDLGILDGIIERLDDECCLFDKTGGEIDLAHLHVHDREGPHRVAREGVFAAKGLGA